MLTDKNYLSLEEVADALGVTYQLIYKLVRSGELPAARLGKLYRVSRADLHAYLERSKREAVESRARRFLVRFAEDNLPPLDGLADLTVSFPWNRMFEADITLEK